MATQAEIDALRMFVSEPDETTYTDEMLVVVIDATSTLNEAASTCS